MTPTDPNILPSWREGKTRTAIIDFVERVTGRDGSEPVPVEQRLAVFDNDGTLWAEKPMPIQLDFILRRFGEMSHTDPALRDRQPWKAAHERDYGWFGDALTAHYAGDDTAVRVLAGGVLAAFAGVTVEEFERQSDEFLRTARNPALDRGYLETAYSPMIELLSYLADNGFSNYIVSGGGRDFMRPITQEVYGIPRQRVIGSTVSLDYSEANGGTITHKPEADYLDDGPQKPIRIWSRTGRRPLLAAGNTNGDIPMLHFTQHPDNPFLRLVVIHDDEEREFAYTAGAEQAIARVGTDAWTGISMKEDWTTIF